MRHNGNLDIVGEIQGLKPQRLAANPAAQDLKEGLIWVNTTDKALRWYNGTEILTLATGGSLDAYLSKEGGTLTGPLILAADGVEALEAATVRQVTAAVSAVAGSKQDTVTGAASTIVTADLAPSVVAVTDSDGKISSSALISVTELNHLDGVTDNIQTQIDLKQDDLGYVPINKAGDAVNGNLNFGGTNTLLNLAAPTDPTSPVRLLDIDQLKADLDFQADVLAVQVDDTLEPLVPGPGVAERYIITNAADLNEAFGTIEGLSNGDIIEKEGDAYVVAYDVSARGPGALVWDRSSSTFQKWNGTAWSEHGGLSSVTVSSGLLKEGNTISVKFGAGVANLPTGEVGVDVAPGFGLALYSNDGTASISDESDSQIGLLLSPLATGGMGVDATGLHIAPLGIKAAHVSSDLFGNGFTGGNGAAVHVKPGDASITVNSDGVKVADISDRYLSLAAASATVTGQISVPAPLADDSIANRKTVTDAVAPINTAITALTTKVDANQFVYDGTVGSAQDSYGVVHNMGNRFVNVDVYDEAFNQLVPDTVKLTDVNTVTVTLAQPQKIYVVVTGKKVVA